MTFVAAYSNGYEGYIPTPATWDEGLRGLSPAPGRGWGGTGGDVLTERAIALARRVWAVGVTFRP